MGYYTRGDDGKPMLVKGEKRVKRTNPRLPNYKAQVQAKAGKAVVDEAGKAQAAVVAQRPVIRRPFMRPAPPPKSLPPHPVPGQFPSPTPPVAEPPTKEEMPFRCVECGQPFAKKGARGPKPKFCGPTCSKRATRKAKAEAEAKPTE